jgi:hypothetical protein
MGFLESDQDRARAADTHFASRGTHGYVKQEVKDDSDRHIGCLGWDTAEVEYRHRARLSEPLLYGADERVFACWVAGELKEKAQSWIMQTEP